MNSSAMNGAHILSTGSAVPSICISNEYLSNTISTSDEWISTRTGIKERRLLPKDKSIIDLATEASLSALQKGLIKAENLDLIILATSSQNDLFGSASQLQASLGAKHAVAFDITAACSGFLIGLITASQFIRTGAYKNILVVGADILSRWVNWTDRRTCILFGDAAGAVILQYNQTNDLLNFQLDSNGNDFHQLSIPYTQTQIHKNTVESLYTYPQGGKYNYLTMNGKEVYKFAVSQVPISIEECLKKAELSTDDISWLVLHQANQRILEAVANKLDIPMTKVISNIKYYGNTSAASIPLALDEAFNSGYICNGDIIVIAGFGAGLTWGTTIIKWHAIH
uniref:Beta-ketoacyl-[acyl-carrier-protein] synthase III n=1 Tax=Liagoropsis maxima TaxID=1653392 RepID=A0A1G4NVI2_9FLOR|nr:Beta-ketoacyl-acyl carrier protein synthase III [Liagoropsis maxima]SCW22701.1 Beta-ketoacyl-acyl carrier protein synthase III [Liagoropsis maxima]